MTAARSSPRATSSRVVRAETLMPSSAWANAMIGRSLLAPSRLRTMLAAIPTTVSRMRSAAWKYWTDSICVMPASSIASIESIRYSRWPRRSRSACARYSSRSPRHTRYPTSGWSYRPQAFISVPNSFASRVGLPAGSRDNVYVSPASRSTSLMPHPRSSMWDTSAETTRCFSPRSRSDQLRQWSSTFRSIPSSRRNAMHASSFPLSRGIQGSVAYWSILYAGRVAALQRVQHPGAEIDEPDERRTLPFQVRDDGLVEFLDEGHFVRDAGPVERFGRDGPTRDSVRIDVRHDPDERSRPQALRDLLSDGLHRAIKRESTP